MVMMSGEGGPIARTVARYPVEVSRAVSYIAEAWRQNNPDYRLGPLSTSEWNVLCAWLEIQEFPLDTPPEALAAVFRTQNIWHFANSIPARQFYGDGGWYDVQQLLVEVVHVHGPPMATARAVREILRVGKQL